MDKQIKKYKDRLGTHRPGGRGRPAAVAAVAPPRLARSPRSPRSRPGRLRLEESGQNFLLEDKDSKQIRVIYRDDDSCCVVQPVKK